MAIFSQVACDSDPISKAMQSRTDPASMQATQQISVPLMGQAVIGAPVQNDMNGNSDTALDSDVQANLLCPSPLSCCLSSCLFCTWLGSVRTIQQNQSAAVMVWGRYVGSVTEPGMKIINPIGTELRMASTARQTMAIMELKVVDLRGNPIMISGNVAYQIYSVKKARVDTIDADTYVRQQAPMVLRKVASQYSYDDLRGDSTGQVEASLRNSLQKAVADAGVKVLQFDLTDLSYAQEIAQAMLVKQQAEAMIEARRLITASAVTIACDAAKQVKTMGHELSKETEEQLIKNVLTVICSHNGVTPTMSV